MQDRKIRKREQIIITSSRSASAQMMRGFLPPHSAVTSFMVAAASAKITFPTDVLPVKATCTPSKLHNSRYGCYQARASIDVLHSHTELLALSPPQGHSSRQCERRAKLVSTNFLLETLQLSCTWCMLHLGRLRAPTSLLHYLQSCTTRSFSGFNTYKYLRIAP